MVQASAERPVSEVRAIAERRGPVRASARARSRMAAGVLVAIVGVLVNLAVYRGLNDKAPVLQLARDVPAGSQLAPEDFTTVKVGVDGAFRAVPAANVNLVVGSYTKVRLVAGTLLAQESLQPTPLVAAGSAVVAVTVPAGEVPIGLRERSRVQLVLVAADRSASTVSGVMVGLPVSGSAAGSSSQVSLSIEVAAADGPRVAAAERTRIALLEPGDGQ